MAIVSYRSCPPALRAVCLLVDVNRPVSTDQLIDRVWADEPPLKARNALAAYISRLRQLLDVADAVHISRGPGGYTLTADPLSIDLHLFRDLVSQARSTDNPSAAAALFGRAIQLWRGEPFAALDTRGRTTCESRLGPAAFGDIGSQ
jgi:DNA-binding SARP family transcriptional activator